MTDDLTTQQVPGWTTDTNGALVVSKPAILDISGKIQDLDIPLRDISAKCYIPVPDGLYAAGFNSPALDGTSLNGSLFLKYYDKSTSQTDSHVFSAFILKKIFGKKALFTYNDNQYTFSWIVFASTYNQRLLFENFDKRTTVNTDAIATIKSEVLNKHNLLLSDAFLQELYKPLLDGLQPVYEQLKNY